GSLILNMLQEDEQKRPPDGITVRHELQRILVRQQETPIYPLGLAPVSQSTGISGWELRTREVWGEEYLTREMEPQKLPSSVTCQDIQLSLDEIAALAWSPDGSLLAAASRTGKVHIYGWPSKEELLTSEKKTLAPFVTWSINEEHSP